MSKIIFDSGISLDGFFAGDNRSPKNPMGGVSGQIHSLMFNQKAFWEYLGFEGGKEDSADGKYIRETIARTGAFIMGKRMFEEGEASWPNDPLQSRRICINTRKTRTLGSRRHDNFLLYKRWN
jgi:dihydrofolate reductase